MAGVCSILAPGQADASVCWMVPVLQVPGSVVEERGRRDGRVAGGDRQVDAGLVVANRRHHADKSTERFDDGGGGFGRRVLSQGEEHDVADHHPVIAASTRLLYVQRGLFP